MREKLTQRLLGVKRLSENLRRRGGFPGACNDFGLIFVCVSVGDMSLRLPRVSRYRIHETGHWA
ncbi:Uncharacterised protein [Grimontia hollisae]|nr:Uncharacterised protein [Grimontia hollisae]